MKYNRFFTKLLHWEFWPWQIVYFPVMVYGLWLSIKSRSFFFFFTVNPGIETGGMLTESKIEILKLIPEELRPKTVLCTYPASLQDSLNQMGKEKINFPVICKPDRGERGWRVEKISGKEELGGYINNSKTDFLIQEFIDMPFEAGIFYSRFPDQDQGFVSSVVIKELLQVKGDGISPVRELVKKSMRGSLQLLVLEKRIPDQMNYVPSKDEKIELVPIGNHSRGTTFYNGNHLIGNQLNDVMNRIGCNIRGFYYGRFDIRCINSEGLLKGENIKILELNGAKSEPAHIYHPGYPILKAYSDLFRHWNTLYKIARMNRKSGIRYPTFSEGWKSWKKFLKYQRLRKRTG